MTNITKIMIESAAFSLVTHINTILKTRKEINKDLVSDEQAEIILRLNLTQQTCLIKRAFHFFKIEVNKEALDQQLHELKQLDHEQDLEDQFLLLGAPLKLMRQLFGMHAADFSRRRNIMGLKGTGCGRPVGFDQESERKIWRAWEKLSELGERERYLRVAEITEYDLHIIWNSLRPYLN